MRSALRSLAAALVLAPATVTAASEALNPRALPSLVERWSLRGDADAMALSAGSLFVVNDEAVTALDAETGDVRWTSHLSGESSWGEELIVVGNRIVVNREGSLLFFDASTGEPRGQVELPGYISAMAGPPLVAVVNESGKNDSLFSIDLEQAKVSATRVLPAEESDLALANGVAMVAMNEAADSLSTRFEGYDAHTLSPLWTFTERAVSEFVRVADRLWIATFQEACGGDTLRSIEPATGALGAPQPPHLDRRWYLSGLPWEYSFEARADEAGDAGGSGSRVGVLYRKELTTSRDAWHADLPGQPFRIVPFGSRLAVAVRRDAGRQLLALLDAGSGELIQLAFGLPPELRRLEAVGDLLLALEPSGVHAYELARFAKPENETRSLRSEVERLLLPPGGPSSKRSDLDSIWQIRAELDLLGPAACPAVVALLPRLDSTGLTAAAGFLEEKHCSDAAAALGRILGSMSLELEEIGWPESKAPIMVLRALSSLGGVAEVPSLARVLRDTNLNLEVRAEAYMALVSIGSPPAISAARALLSEGVTQRSALEPASPLPLLPLIGAPEPALVATPGCAECKADFRTWGLWRAASGAAVLSIEGDRRIVVYRDGSVGGSDNFWLAVVDAGGQLAEGPWFTGGRLGTGRHDDPRISLAGSATQVSIRNALGSALLTVALADLKVDQDGDGLTDLVEKRLRLDPARPDTDGDGLADGVDPAPNARKSAPQTDEEKARLALFAQLFQLIDRRRPDHTAMIVWQDQALEWRGREGPTLTLPPEEREAFFEEAGLDGIAHLFIDAWSARTPDGGPARYDACPKANEVERSYDVRVFRGGLSAVYYCAVMKPVDGNWLLRRLRIVGVS